MPGERFPYWRSLKTHSQQKRLKDLLRRQLAKDLQLFLREIPEEDLWNTLRQRLQELALQPEHLADLCYRVDLGEEVKLSTWEAGELAMLILEREARKIIFREQYAGRLP